jgi:hypothetical protein
LVDRGGLTTGVPHPAVEVLNVFGAELVQAVSAEPQNEMLPDGDAVPHHRVLVHGEGCNVLDPVREPGRKRPGRAHLPNRPGLSLLLQGLDHLGPGLAADVTAVRPAIPSLSK